MIKNKHFTALALVAALSPVFTESMLGQCAGPCPPNATDCPFTAYGPLAFRVNPDGTTGPFITNETVAACSTIRIRMAVAYAPVGPSGGTSASFSGGNMTIRTADGLFSEDVTPASGIPMMSPASDTGIGGCGVGGTNFLWSEFTSDFDLGAHQNQIANGVITFVAAYGPENTVVYLCPPITNLLSGISATQVHVARPPNCTVVPEIVTARAGNSVSLNVSPSGVGPFTFQWSGPNGFVSSNQSITLNNVGMEQSGVYTVIAVDAMGCMTASSGTLIVKPGGRKHVKFLSN